MRADIVPGGESIMSTTSKVVGPPEPASSAGPRSGAVVAVLRLQARERAIDRARLVRRVELARTQRYLSQLDGGR